MDSFLKRHAEGLRLFLLVFVTLYLELALIRFASANVLYLGFFSNFVLIAVFLGIGLGFLVADRTVDLFRYLPQALLFLLSFILVTRIDATSLRESAGQLFFSNVTRLQFLPTWLCLLVIFSITAFIFACIAQETARCFRFYKPIVAYSIDIGGSVVGIAVFTLHSYLGGTPIAWFLVSLSLITVLSARYSLLNAAAIASGVFLLLAGSQSPHYNRWSPYQHIEVTRSERNPETERWDLTANGIGHQSMQPVGTKEAIYDFPYTELVERRGGKEFENVLVLGSGGGTDVSYALHYGVKHVDAVEIDPEILKAGKTYHPNRPYADERVTAHTNDGRAFMEQTDQRYDLIIYALTDSLASLSNLSNIRLESFLFTTESFQQAKDLLADDGVIVLYNYYRKDWLVHKLSDMLTDTFGHTPVVSMYTSEDEGKLAALAIGPQLSGPPRDREAMALATDNWPFLYMQRPQLPKMYVTMMLMFIGCAVVGVALTGNASVRDIHRNGPFLLMGAAFLLLETKSIIQFSLLFGATWLVNSLFFFAVLVSVLIANLLVTFFSPRRPTLLFALLFGALAIQFSVPVHRLLEIESLGLRYVLGSVIFFSPIFCANLVFGYLFKDTPHSASAFGWNIVGAMIGGALEYTSLAIGYQMLTLVVAGLYGACAVWTYWAINNLPVSSEETADTVVPESSAPPLTAEPAIG